MKSSGSTHAPRAIDPTRFRNAATGIGTTCEASEMTGAMRAARVSAAMPPAQRAAAPRAEGFDTSVAYQAPDCC